MKQRLKCEAGHRAGAVRQANARRRISGEDAVTPLQADWCDS